MLRKKAVPKILFSIFLILLIGYALIKIFPRVEVNYAPELIPKEQITIESEELLSYSALQSKLSTFKIDKTKLSSALSAEGVNIEEFNEQVKIEFIIPENVNDERSITIYFRTNSTNPKLSVGYKNIAQQVSKYINGQSS